MRAKGAPLILSVPSVSSVSSVVQIYFRAAQPADMVQCNGTHARPPRP